jgi:hypothetical protein
MKYVLRVVASVLYFVLVGCVALGSQVGDCVPIGEHVCPTDADRNHWSVLVLVVGFALYLPLGWLVLRHERRG